MSKRIALAILSFAAAAPGCGTKDFTSSMALGGQTVDADTLNAGREAYMLNCYACHGEKGDGKGPSAPGLRPPPRDFRQGVFKFGAVAGGQLPNDADLLRIVKGGLHGTPMLPWDIADGERLSIIQYIKTFSPRWQEDKPGDPIVATPDPWAGKEAGGVARGARVYHGMAQCLNCHPSYATKQEIWDWTKDLIHSDANFREDMYAPVAKESDFLVDGQKLKIPPPDFTFNRLRSGETLPDIYRTIASGIGGTAMPTWKNVLPETDLWAMTHYVKSLVDLRDTLAARALMQKLATQPAFTPPAPPPDVPPPAETPPAGKGAGKAKPAAPAPATGRQPA